MDRPHTFKMTKTMREVHYVIDKKEKYKKKKKGKVP